MRLMESAFLGSAAALFTLVRVQAADLPVKANTVEYVKVCSLYGAGFWYIPGTETCMKIAGFLRIDSTFNGGVYDQPAWSGDLGIGDRFADQIVARARLGLGVDTRTVTEYGVVRTYAQADFTFNNFGSTNPAAVGTPPSPLGGLNATILNGVGGGYVAIAAALIQFAGFTFGKSFSAFSTPWAGYPGNNTSYLIGGHDTVTGVNNIKYTASFGNGASATVGLDDPSVYNRTPLYNLALGVAPYGFGTNAYGGFAVPDLVGNIRVDQAWGLFQISGGLHTVNASYNVLGAGGVPLSGATAVTDSLLSGHPDSKVGGAVMVALQIKNIPTGPGDDIKFDATWAKGDTKDVISTSATSPSFLMFGGVPGQLGPNASFGFGSTNDGTYLPVAFGGDGTIHLTTAYGIRGAFNHNWNPYWSTSLFGGMGWMRMDSTSQANYCAAYGAAVAGLNMTYTCNPNYSISMLGAVTRWTPVKNLAFSAEAIWTRLNQGFAGFATFSPGAPEPAQTWSYKNQETVSFNIRGQRNF